MDNRKRKEVIWNDTKALIGFVVIVLLGLALFSCSPTPEPKPEDPAPHEDQSAPDSLRLGFTLGFTFGLNDITRGVAIYFNRRFLLALV